MKILCIGLGVMVALLMGTLAFSIQYNQFFLMPQPTEEELLEAAKLEPEVEVVSEVLVSPDMGLAEELLVSLKKAHEELDEAKLKLDKRDQNLQALNASYLKLQKETMVLISELEVSLATAREGEGKNFKKLAAVYSKMSSEGVAKSLLHMEPERVAIILTSMESRAMASVMDEAGEASADGSEVVAQWSEAIRLMGEEKE